MNVTLILKVSSEKHRPLGPRYYRRTVDKVRAVGRPTCASSSTSLTQKARPGRPASEPARRLLEIGPPPPRASRR